jgi:DNA mismatch repair protein MutL
MADIIQLLSESVANQIAAGEVIQRPASVVKELLENSVDAGASDISIIIKDAGKTLIQIIDNGTGMSETDARMAFERHATSKIKKADDLYCIRSMGFRGEALASVAAVAEVVLQTKTQADETGTEITVRATDVISQEQVACNTGTNLAVKNLFFNVPARRKFLKSDSYELRLIISEIQRVALSFPEIEFKFFHNNTEILNLAKGNLKQRIVSLFGKAMNQNLIDIKTRTSITNVTGFVGKPENAKKNQGEQFFFVNNRYMRHPYFHKALLNAYERIIRPDTVPSYFIFLEVEPDKIDVNIHPTKTEIKFEDEQAIWQIIHASVKEALGKFTLAPSLDFDAETAIDIPVLTKDTQIKIPTTNYNADFNPFDDEIRQSGKQPTDFFKRSNLNHWEDLYAGFEKGQNEYPEISQQKLFDQSSDEADTSPGIIQIKNRYILCAVKSGIMLIDQKRAHERVLYENFLETLAGTKRPSQQTLFPQVIELNPVEHNLLMEYVEDINESGFDIRDFGNNTVVINGCPEEIKNPKEFIQKLIEEMNSQPKKQDVQTREYLASTLSKASAIPYGKALSLNEMRDLIDKLFACANHNYNPDGKAIISIIEQEEMDKKFK